jgi:hypothetical protein
MSATTIPVTVAEDAAARVAQLGMQREFEQMIEHAKQALPHLRAIRVTLEYNPECPHEDPGVVIWAHRSDSPAPGHAGPNGFGLLGVEDPDLPARSLLQHHGPPRPRRD